MKWRKVKIGERDVDFALLRRGDTFQLSEDDGGLIGTFLAVSDAKPCDPVGNFEIQVEAVTR